jgi:Tfp pilus assembly protein PilF
LQFYDSFTLLLRRGIKPLYPVLIKHENGRVIMAISGIVAAALMGAANLPAVPAEREVDRIDVAFEELARGDPVAAIERIRSNPEISENDPAALINLGTAHARMGQRAAAENYYRAAITSRQRYALELADGTWMDSRRAARLAMDRLQQRQALAPR